MYSKLKDLIWFWFEYYNDTVVNTQKPPLLSVVNKLSDVH